MERGLPKELLERRRARLATRPVEASPAERPVKKEESPELSEVLKILVKYVDVARLREEYERLNSQLRTVEEEISELKKKLDEAERRRLELSKEVSSLGRLLKLMGVL